MVHQKKDESVGGDSPLAMKQWTDEVVRKIDGDYAKETRQEACDSTEDIYPLHIRVCKRKVISPFSEPNVAVSTTIAGRMW